MPSKTDNSGDDSFKLYNSSRRRKSAAEVARNMGAIRSTGGKAEMVLRSALHRLGWRFRKNYPALPGKPDVAFMKQRVAVFVDGDFWHGRELRERGPEWLKSRFATDQQPYWSAKLQRNVDRDEAVTAELRRMGWRVLRYWESQVAQQLDAIVKDIEGHLEAATDSVG